MISLLHFICTLILTFLVQTITPQQSYDTGDCDSHTLSAGSNYQCNTNKETCQTFIVYRTQQNIRTPSSISSLFNSNETQLLSLNNLTEQTSHSLSINHEILVPIDCSCSATVSQLLLQYNSSGMDTYTSIACVTFEGLSKMQMIAMQNPYAEGRIPENSTIDVPIRCACPDGADAGNGTEYLVSYPVQKGDNVTVIALKFNVSEEMIWNANNLSSLAPNPTIYPQTTLLIPTKEVPVLNVASSPPLSKPSLNPRVPIVSGKVERGRKRDLKNAYTVLGVGSFTAIVLLFASFLLIRRIRNREQQSSVFSSPRSFQLSSLSPDLLEDVSKLKHPLFNYSLEELKMATGDFSEASKISNSVYQGRIYGSNLAIKQMGSEEAHRIIEILTRINHINIVKLYGCCYMDQPYLVFDLAANGCLRDCLSNPTFAKELTWTRRVKIALDVAVGLYYIHCCTNPCYVHRNINSRIVLITADWRAQLSGFGSAKPLPHIGNDKDEGENNKWKDTMIMGRKGYLAPEYLHHGLASPKVDVFALGIVLLELISGKEAVGDCMLKDLIGFLTGGGLEGSSNCLEKLKDFMDPCLEGDYPIGDALCLALLAKVCVEEDPLHRPTMNDVLTALSRMI